MRSIHSSSNDYARYEIFAGLFESVCLACNRLLGISKNIRGLDILEKAHRCPHCQAVQTPAIKNTATAAGTSKVA